jgi:hypothetical protein
MFGVGLIISVQTFSPTDTRLNMWPYGDARLSLHGVPTGCYRLKYVYAPSVSPRTGNLTVASLMDLVAGENTQSASLQARSISDLIATGQAVSFGASRPFRVLSPVLAVQPLPLPSGQTSLKAVWDTPLQLSIMANDLSSALYWCEILKIMQVELVVRSATSTGVIPSLLPVRVLAQYGRSLTI